jgi:uncharacterized protein (TIGR02646 family)
MIKITAAAPPAIFAFHRANKSTYLQLSSEDAIRKALWDEQRGLCAYCERRLDYALGRPHRTRIEHFHPQNPAPGSTLDAQACCMASGASPLADSDTTWTNLLLCCDGQEARGADLHHCDVTKRDTDICAPFRNPKTFQAPRLLDVHHDGRVVPISELPPGAAGVVEDVLMLNRKSLTTVRGQLYRSLFRQIATEKRRPPFGMTAARRTALRATLTARARDNPHPSVTLSVADLL